jgi:hypothetical protein
MFKIICLVLSFTITWQAFGCEVPVTPLKEGDKSPCTGFLFSPDQEHKLRVQNQDYNNMIEEVKIYLQQKELFQKELGVSQQIIDKEQQKAEIWRKAAEDSTQKLVEKEERQTFRDWLFLLAGVGLTAVAGYAVGQSGKR